MTQIIIDGHPYDLESLSDSARQQLGNLQATDAEIQRLTIQLAIAQTARAAYSAALKSHLPAS